MKTRSGFTMRQKPQAKAVFQERKAAAQSMEFEKEKLKREFSEVQQNFSTVNSEVKRLLAIKYKIDQSNKQQEHNEQVLW